MRNTHLLRRALLCVAVIIGSLLLSSAEASKTVTIGRGDSLDSLARRYRVPVRAIASANGISTETILRDGRKLVIPDPPKTLIRPATMNREGMVTGNRIAIRSGPDQNRQRLTLVDHGYALEVQRKAGDWYQVKTQIGRIGWIRSDFVTLSDSSASVRVASTRPTKLRRNATGSSGDDHSARRTSSRSRSARVASRDRSSSSRRNRNTASSSRSRGRGFASSKGRRSRPEADAPKADMDVIRTAYAYRGTPYRFGASGKRGFDCSGFTSYVYRKQGVALPHNAAAQFGHGKRVKSTDMKAGDLVFFHTTRRGISHVGIYAGKGKFVHASSRGGSVRVDSLNSGYYRSRLVGARRLK